MSNELKKSTDAHADALYRQANGADAPDLPPLPQPNCTYADHSYPAYNKHALTAYARAALAQAAPASRPAAEGAGELTYTVDGVKMSPLEYISHLHTLLIRERARPTASGSADLAPASPASAPVDELAAFEAWALKCGLIQESFGIQSNSSHCNTALKAWQARAALVPTPAHSVGVAVRTWQDRTGNHNIRPGSVKHMLAEIADLRAALAAPVEQVGVPIAWLRFWAAQRYTGEGNIECDEGYEVCRRDDKGVDGSLAFPVFAAPLPPVVARKVLTENELHEMWNEALNGRPLNETRPHHVASFIRAIERHLQGDLLVTRKDGAA